MTDTKIIFEHPPNIDEIDAVFNVKNKQGILYAFGGSVYNPDKIIIPDHLIVHENVHLFRMAKDSGRWWKNYLRNDVFRLDEEIAAHRAEWGWYAYHNTDKNDQTRYLHFMCQRLAGPLYGNLLTVKEARARLLGAL